MAVATDVVVVALLHLFGFGVVNDKWLSKSVGWSSTSADRQRNNAELHFDTRL